MIDIGKITTLDIETINNCNAQCPLCLREQLTTKTNDRLDWHRITNNISDEVWKKVSRINFNGTTGDNIMHSDIFEILEWCGENTYAYISLHTNGSLRDTRWWGDLGRMLGKYKHRVVFGIDGLEDTHARYRVGTDWTRIINNSRSFIEAGGIAEWQMILFDHNKHQIDQCRDLSQQLGFYNFFTIYQDRMGDDQSVNSIKKYPLTKDSVQKITEIKDSCNPVTKKIKSCGEISCRSQEIGWISIYADGTIWPCCWLMGWHQVSATPTGMVVNHHLKKILKVDLDEISIYNNKLENIISSDLWQNRYPESFKKIPNAICIQQCKKIS